MAASLSSAEKMRAVIRLVSEGKSLDDIARIRGMPSKQTLTKWLSGTKLIELEFKKKYDEALLKYQEKARAGLTRNGGSHLDDYEAYGGDGYFESLGKSAFTPPVARKILERISTGETLTTICRDPGMPSYDKVRSWLTDKSFRYHDEFSKAFEKARAMWLDYIIEDTIDIADKAARMAKGPKLKIEGAKLRIQTRKMVAEKFDPDRYSDSQRLKIKDETNASNGIPSEETMATIRDIATRSDVTMSAREVAILRLKSDLAQKLLKRNNDIDIEVSEK